MTRWLARTVCIVLGRHAWRRLYVGSRGRRFMCSRCHMQKVLLALVFFYVSVGVTDEEHYRTYGPFPSLAACQSDQQTYYMQEPGAGVTSECFGRERRQ